MVHRYRQREADGDTTDDEEDSDDDSDDDSEDDLDDLDDLDETGNINVVAPAKTNKKWNSTFLRSYYGM